MVSEIDRNDSEDVTCGGRSLRSGNVVKKIVEVTKEQLRGNLKGLVDEVSYAIDSIEGKSTKYKLDSVEITLAISGEGTIYVATAGAEASITLTLQRNAE